MEPLLGGSIGRMDLRVSRDGYSYFAVKAFVLGYWTKDSMTVKPRLRVPTDEQLMSTLAKDAGFVSTSSDKGDLEQRWLTLGGGLQRVTEDLTDPASATILKHFVDYSPNQPADFDHGVLIRQERFIDLRALEFLMGDRAKAVAWADDALARRIIRRGAVIKCPYCRSADWYPLELLTQAAQCTRCGEEHIFTSETETFYRLNGAIREAMNQHSYVSLLALENQRRLSKRGFHFIPATVLTGIGAGHGGVRREVDFICARDGKLVVGEAKKGGKLSVEDKRQLTRLAGVCRALYADSFLVATAALAWEGSARQFFAGELAAALGETSLKTLNGVDLGWASPGDFAGPGTT